MPAMLENAITHAVADPRTRSVTLSWQNGATTVSLFGHRVGTGVFAALADPAVFVQVGRWPQPGLAGGDRLLRRRSVV